MNRPVKNVAHLVPAIWSISFELLSMPVALPRDSLLRPVKISMGVIELSMGSAHTCVEVGWVEKYSEQLNLRSGLDLASSSREVSS